ncbi:ATPase family AAA domain-containing protein 1 [Colletotrichum salicis]|uniref:ATPase family AAA domain-containing protein 1 n=1 Tax=Colletotrichum salicis TaxID=1209931 RepID=A0A135TR21_9PEZI|nr:ATPase family AAA domain-containing protein 1 [Colletotrichum salicis]
MSEALSQAIDAKAKACKNTPQRNINTGSPRSVQTVFHIRDSGNFPEASAKSDRRRSFSEILGNTTLSIWSTSYGINVWDCCRRVGTDSRLCVTVNPVGKVEQQTREELITKTRNRNVSSLIRELICPDTLSICHDALLFSTSLLQVGQANSTRSSSAHSENENEPQPTSSEPRSSSSEGLVGGSRQISYQDVKVVVRRVFFHPVPSLPLNQVEASDMSRDWTEKMEQVARGCNEFEKELLGSVVNPKNLKVTWDDVILDQEMKDTMTHTISMARHRPEASSSVLLESVRINGALLYGPPGTGKTHLCRAVAPSSGSAMISVDLASVESIWVGETEKYVKAASTLAEKLHSCVLFTDEVDSLFFRRSSSNTSQNRRGGLTQIDGLSASQKAPFV